MVDLEAHIDRIQRSNVLNPSHADFNAGVKAAVDAALPRLRGSVGQPDRIEAEIDALTREIEGIIEGPVSIPEIIERQIDEALEVAALFELTSDDKPLPSKDGLRRAIMKDVGAVEWEKIEKFREPTLLLVPYPTSMERYQAGINSGACKGPANAASDAYISDFTSQTFSADALSTGSEGKILGWRFVITEGAKDMTDAGDWNKQQVGGNTPRNDERIRMFENHFQGTKIEGMDYPAYIVLQMLAMKKGEPVDGVKYGDYLTFSLLTKHQRGGRVAGGRWAPVNQRVLLDSANLAYRILNARVRASVMGDVES